MSQEEKLNAARDEDAKLKILLDETKTGKRDVEASLEGKEKEL